MRLLVFLLLVSFFPANAFPSNEELFNDLQGLSSSKYKYSEPAPDRDSRKRNEQEISSDNVEIRLSTFLDIYEDGNFRVRDWTNYSKYFKVYGKTMDVYLSLEKNPLTLGHRRREYLISWNGQEKYLTEYVKLKFNDLDYLSYEEYFNYNGDNVKVELLMPNCSRCVAFCNFKDICYESAYVRVSK